jgi:hypothetical protein
MDSMPSLVSHWRARWRSPLGVGWRLGVGGIRGLLFARVFGAGVVCSTGISVFLHAGLSILESFGFHAMSSWSESLHAWLSISSSECVSHSVSAAVKVCAGVAFGPLPVVCWGRLLVRRFMVSKMDVCLWVHVLVARVAALCCCAFVLAQATLVSLLSVQSASHFWSFCFISPVEALGM